MGETFMFHIERAIPLSFFFCYCAKVKKQLLYFLLKNCTYYLFCQDLSNGKRKCKRISYIFFQMATFLKTGVYLIK